MEHVGAVTNSLTAVLMAVSSHFAVYLSECSFSISTWENVIPFPPQLIPTFSGAVFPVILVEHWPRITPAGPLGWFLGVGGWGGFGLPPACFGNYWKDSVSIDKAHLSLKKCPALDHKCSFFLLLWCSRMRWECRRLLNKNTPLKPLTAASNFSMRCSHILAQRGPLTETRSCLRFGTHGDAVSIFKVWPFT